jgi:hypothetical protein
VDHLPVVTRRGRRYVELPRSVEFEAVKMVYVVPEERGVYFRVYADTEAGVRAGRDAFRAFIERIRGPWVAELADDCKERGG